MNRSKVHDRRFWKRWYASGAIAQTTSQAEVLSIVTIRTGIYTDHSVLALFTEKRPPFAVVVPAKEVEKYRFKKTIPHVPRNAVPAGLFFVTKKDFDLAFFGQPR